jgi:hypothetical protein
MVRSAAGRSSWRKLMDEHPSREWNIVVDPLGRAWQAVVMRTTVAVATVNSQPLKLTVDSMG